jgi:hypothetical protein
MPESDYNASDSSRRKRERSPVRKAAKVLEWIGGALLILLIVATPWMFGTTEDWSIRVMNFGSYGAGAIMLIAAILNRVAGATIEISGRERVFKYLFFALNIAVLVFCAIALWNARASFAMDTRSFAYNPTYNRALPTTYDADATRAALLQLTAFFVAFWSLRYWIQLGDRRGGSTEESGTLRNKRFQIVAWVFALNGFAIGIQGILQRLSRSSRLLWFRDSWWGDPLACFGPFSYRGNAAEFLNLLWPVALGLWWIMTRERRRRMSSSRLITDGPELLLIPATVVMIAACIVSLSRGGAVIAAATLIVLATLFLFQRTLQLRARIGAGIFVAVVVVSVWFLGWDALTKRFQSDGMTNLSGRQEIYNNAKLISRDFPKFGSGPGSFSAVYHLYRQSPGEWWQAFLHDDWLETRVTFGALGLGLVIAHLLILPFWIGLPGRSPVFYGFHACVMLGLAAALVQAKFDFPFQTYSIAFTFIAVTAMLTSISPARR